MDYRIIENNEEGIFIEVPDGTFRTRIELNFDPPSDFHGIAVGCNYNYKGHPIGKLIDNNLVIGKIQAKTNHCTFEVGYSEIQAGPTLIENFTKQNKIKNEGFSNRQIAGGLHMHIGKKKFGNYIIGCTYNLTFRKIADKYEELNAQNAIKLPGLENGSFLFKNKVNELRRGVFPIPVALVIEARKN